HRGALVPGQGARERRAQGPPQRRSPHGGVDPKAHTGHRGRACHMCLRGGRVHGQTSAAQFARRHPRRGTRLHRPPEGERVQVAARHRFRARRPREWHHRRPRPRESIQKHIQDIAGVRVTCAFGEDVYTVKHLLLSLPDVTLVEERDYIAHPKENGYKSLHLIVSVPVVRASGTTDVTVEIQTRTIAMDFWASLEHKIYYKYNGNVPAGITESLRDAAIVANLLDHRMQDLRHEVHSFNSP